MDIFYWEFRFMHTEGLQVIFQNTNLPSGHDLTQQYIVEEYKFIIYEANYHKLLL